MRFARGWRWWERVFGALCGALAAYMWMAILIPGRESKQTGLSGARQAHRRTGSKARSWRDRSDFGVIERVFPSQTPKGR